MSTTRDELLNDAPGTLKINMGPSHPAMHGIVRIILELDGETVKSADMEIGYLHRAFEKHAVQRFVAEMDERTFDLSGLETILGYIRQEAPP